MAARQVLLLILVFVTFSADHVCSQDAIYPSENPAVVGNSVTLFSKSKVSAGLWLHNAAAVVIFSGGSPTVAAEYSGRVDFNLTSSDLTIKSVQLGDAGTYKLQDLLNGVTAKLTLQVEERIANVTLTANSLHLVEFNDTAELKCSVTSGSSLNYTWFDGNSVIEASSRFEISDDGANLTIVNVTREDTGPFRCNVSNRVSHEMSQPLYLNISYGPDRPSITISPEQDIYKSGENITLSCSAMSSPTAMVQWVFDTMYLDEFGPKLHLENVTQNQTGYYKCLFHNQVTSRFSSAHTMIRIVAPISAVTVETMGKQPIEHQPFTLYCNVDGTVDHITWWMGGKMLASSNQTSIDNSTLTLHSVQMSDGGDYQCRASNAVSNLTSSAYTLHVNYGPGEPVITGPSSAPAGREVVFNCSAPSYPPSRFVWYFNDTPVSHSSHFVSAPLALNMSGTYKCMAFNNVTGQNSSSYAMLTVLAPVTMAMVKIAGAQPVSNRNFSLTCHTVGYVEHIHWMLDHWPLHNSSRMSFSMDNTTLTFDPVLHSDNGYYRCMASNYFSSYTSANFSLKVMYGPENVKIEGANYAVEGKSVNLSCSASSYPPSHYKWYFNHTEVANTSEFTTRPLTFSDSGTYRCKAYNDVTNHTLAANHTLWVIAPITSVEVQAPPSHAIAGHQYSFTCNASGPVDGVYWVKNGEMLHPMNGSNIFMDNATLTFDPVKRNDGGQYQCKAVSPAEYKLSPAYTLAVNFGPDKPNITGPSVAVTGQNVSLACWALSVPPSTYSWWVDGRMWASTAELTITPSNVNMSHFTCVAYNNVTKLNSSSTKTLTIIEGIKAVKVQSDSTPINTKNLTLTCNITGPYDAIYWMRNNMSIYSSGSMTIANTSLHFHPVTLKDDGVYQCVATNLVGKHKSPGYELKVNYGPVNMSITEPITAPTGTILTLACKAKSHPESVFKWYYNSATISIASGNEFIVLASLLTQGSYTCKATNDVTGITMQRTTTLNVTSNAAARLPCLDALMAVAVLALLVPTLSH